MIVRQAAVEQRFAQAFVCVFELNVFTDDRNARFACRMTHAMDEIDPRFQILRVRMLFELQEPQNLRVEAFAGEFDRHRIYCCDVFHRNDAGFGDVAEERDFSFRSAGMWRSLRQSRMSG